MSRACPMGWATPSRTLSRARSRATWVSMPVAVTSTYGAVWASSTTAAGRRGHGAGDGGVDVVGVGEVEPGLDTEHHYSGVAVKVRMTLDVQPRAARAPSE